MLYTFYISYIINFKKYIKVSKKKKILLQCILINEDKKPLSKFNNEIRLNMFQFND